MTDYVKSTNFASKDSLSVGNPLKIVKGTEIDAEFNNIATAIDTKADLNSPIFIGAPVAPTAGAGTNTTQLSTTAFVQSTVQAALAASVYPVGSLYLNATNATNPATLLGFGTWVSFGAGRMPVGFNAADPLFDAAEEVGGSKDATLVSHSHTWSGSSTTTGAGAHSHSINDPGHKHLISGDIPQGATGYYSPSAVTSNDSRPVSNDTNYAYTGISINGVGDHTHSVSLSGTTSDNGSSATNANLPPYITVYMWKRVS
jgi:hypothetical protein